MTEAERKNAYNSWKTEKNTGMQNAREALPDNIKEFLNGSTESNVWVSLCGHVNSGGKPSEFIERRMGALFGDYIRKDLKKYLLWSADNITNWQYAQSYWRRSYRSSDISVYCEQFKNIITSFARLSFFESDITAILSGNLPEFEKMHLNDSGYYSNAPYEFVVGNELDNNNENVLKAVENIIMGEGTVLTRDLIRGILRSRNAQAHQLLGKLLLAAKLQEGVRQSICENADCGTREAFVYILGIIINNDLIRFSSVKRAAATWCGLFDADPSSFERIAEKTVRLMYECMNDKKACEGYLSSEDAMELYIALWAISFDDAVNGMQTVCSVMESGTKHQRMVCGIFVRSFDSRNFENHCGKYALEHFSEETDTMAVFINCFMPSVSGMIQSASEKMVPYWAGREKEVNKRIHTHINTYFSSKEEARRFYAILRQIRGSMIKKELKFEQCVFPWNTSSISKSDLAVRMAYIASALKDNELMDEVCGMISEMSYSRSAVLVLLTAYPETEVQQNTAVAAMADRETQTCTQAYKIASDTLKLSENNYTQLGDMLRFKSSDIRKNAISLLLRQSDKSLLKCCKQLLSDKNGEKRLGGLDIMLQIKKDSRRVELFEQLKLEVKSMNCDISKEKILIEEILDSGSDEPQEGFGLYTSAPKPPPKIDQDYINKCREVFKRYFPNGSAGEGGKKNKKGGILGILGGKSKEDPDFAVALKKLDALINEHANDEFIGYNGETGLLGNSNWLRTSDNNMAFLDMWLDFYKREICTPELLERMHINLLAYMETEYFKIFKLQSNNVAARLLGKDIVTVTPLKYKALIQHIICALRGTLSDTMFKNTAALGLTDINDRTMIAAAAANWMCSLPDNEFVIDSTGDPSEKTYYGNSSGKRSVYLHPQIASVLNPLGRRMGADDMRRVFPVAYALYAKTDFISYYIYFNAVGAGYPTLSAVDMLRACAFGVISDSAMYRWFFTRSAESHNRWQSSNFEDVLSTLSTSIKFVRERDKAVSTRIGYRYEAVRAGDALIGKTDENEFTEEDIKVLVKAREAYENVINVILETELKRGDSETQFSKSIRGIKRIYSVKNYVRILTAMGKDTFDRSTWYSNTSSKKDSLSHLISVCVPDETDNAETLRELVKNTDITEKRLIEAAMYSPEWIDITEDYLGWDGFRSGCYYFMAHMNERFDAKREAVIAKYSPLSPEELQGGAFDIDWFREAHSLLGEKRFKTLYDAAKYISDGAKHSRARKYADAAMGLLDTTATEQAIDDKRNKDLLMAYSIIPIENEDDIMRRYLFLQKFLKESKSFGAQRRASESAAVEIAMRNLATAAGLSDVTRLKLRMETRFFESIKEHFVPHRVGDVNVWLEVDGGKTELKIEKDGKVLKSVPAKLKKDEYIEALISIRKQLNEQYRRTRVMLEQSMEDRSVFTLGEINMLKTNPVAASLTENLVYCANGKCMLIKNGLLVDVNGEICIEDNNCEIIIAHPIDMHYDGTWRDYQKYLFDNQLVQPFRQVFRELYIKTDEEIECFDTRRYAGNQIQVKKTIACLKSRRWVCDVEDGLQKVYFKDNIVAKLYALADWFSPSDIEAPTLEWVGFFDRKTGEPIRIKDIPDIIFSEVMRDADLAVSVCHAGGVDPEHSHSTIEMRAAILQFTLPLFKLSNCEINGSHVFIKGSRAEYSVHLGSGVCHLRGGAMLNILPVHSQHRGRIFLPFVDDDPKTAEIISKVLLLAEDKKIKDPSIISQIGM